MIARRPETETDREFLCALYASTRADELAPVPWPDEAKVAFLRSQFDAQAAHYREHYAGAELSVIERDGVPIGRLYVHRGPADVRIMDIALVPESTGHGIGSRLLAEVLEEARLAGKKLSIHVEQDNPAKRLYERLGFVKVAETGIYQLMEKSWTVGSS